MVVFVVEGGVVKSEISQWISVDVLERFVRYAAIHTTSDSSSRSSPSTQCQLDLLRLLERELRGIGLKDVHIDSHSYLWGTMPANREGTEPLGLLAHVDTSPDQSGEGVKPLVRKNYDGGVLRYPDDPELVLDPQQCPELLAHKGGTLVTASGRTLLGADDKAGVAEIMTAVGALARFPELPHGEIVVCFTHDEEIGRGVADLDTSKLPHACYTLDGGVPGELEYECFDAWKVVVTFHGSGVHPGYAKNKLINAASIAARFIAALPEAETPEHTEKREGFFHVSDIEGSNEKASVELIVRDFEELRNKERIQLLESLVSLFELRHPGLKVSLETTHQYKNMYHYIKEFPGVIERARRAIERTGLPVIERPIRGGTDGSVLSERGHPTPNIFAGEMLIHSRREWVGLSSMEKAVETILYLVES